MPEPGQPARRPGLVCGAAAWGAVFLLAGCSDVGEDPEATAVAFIEALEAGDVRTACERNVSEGVLSPEDDFLLSVCTARVAQAFTPLEIEQFLTSERTVEQTGARAVVTGGNTTVRLVQIGTEWHTDYHFEQGSPATDE